MFKKIIFLAVVAISISSCSTYNGFNKRKYYNFDNSTSDFVRASEGNITKEDAILSNIVNEEKNVNNQPQVDKEEIKITSEDAKEITTGNKIASKGNSNQIVDKGPITSIIKNVKQNHSISTGTEKRPGRFWWLWAIDVLIGLILALFVSAYFGLALMIVGIVFTVICLIRYIKSK